MFKLVGTPTKWTIAVATSKRRMATPVGWRCITAVHWEEKSSGHFSSPLYTPSKNQACGQMATGKEQRLHVVFRPKIARSQKYLITKSGLT